MADDHLMTVDNDDVDYNVLCERLVLKRVISEQDKEQIQGKPATEQKEFIIRKAVAAGQDGIKNYINCLEELTKTSKVGRDVMKQPDGRIVIAVTEPKDGLPDTVGVAFSDGEKVYIFTPWHLFTDLSGLEAVKEEKLVYFKIQYENGDVKFAERGQLILRCQELNACIHHVTGVSVQRIRRGPMVVAVTSDDDLQGTAVLLINKFMWSGEGDRHECHGHTAVPLSQDPAVVALPTKLIFRDKTTVQCENIEKCRSCECLKFQLDPTTLPKHLKLRLLSTRSWRVGSSDVKQQYEKDSDGLYLHQSGDEQNKCIAGDIVLKDGVKLPKECDILDVDGDIGYRLEGLMKGLIIKTQKNNETNEQVVSRLECIEYIMENMQQQNQVIIDMMSENQQGQTTPVELPDFPLSSEEDLRILEFRLKDGTVMDKMVRDLKKVEVDDAKKHTKTILSRLMTKELASKFTWIGTVDKKPFKDLLVNKLVQSAVRRNPNHSETTNELIKEYTTQWLTVTQRLTVTRAKSTPRKPQRALLGN